MADHYNDYFEIDKLIKSTSDRIVTKLRSQFAKHGIPENVVNDGGTSFTSTCFKTFAMKWKFKHTITSSYHSQANRKAEILVKEAKKLVKKCAAEQSDIYLAFLNNRNTPTPSIKSSLVK